MITQEFINYVDKSVLCWIATSNEQNVPNVSPKDIFGLYKNKTLLVANIASPGTVANIKVNPMVCVSFLEIFIQKGFKIRGEAKIIEQTDEQYEAKLRTLVSWFDKSLPPIISLIEIEIMMVDKIIAPSYHFFPELSEEDHIESAMTTYKVVSVFPDD